MTTAEKLILSQLQELSAQVAKLTATMLPSEESKPSALEAVEQAQGMSIEEKVEHYRRLGVSGRRRR